MIPVVIEMAKLRARVIERNWRELVLSTPHVLSHASTIPKTPFRPTNMHMLSSHL